MSQDTAQPTVAVGDIAPEFALRDQHGAEVALSSFRGEQSVLVVFYPFAFSGICTGELCEIRDDIAAVQNDAVQVLAVSCDPVYSLRAWAEDQGFPFPLLSDFWPHGAVASAYGVFDPERGMAVRGSFLVDVDGVVRWSVVNGPGQARDLTAHREALTAL
jgi:mycoredoxin-dependent peroxiredoxin